MLPIIFSLLGALGLHARPRAVLVRSQLSPRPACAPYELSRVSWTPSGASALVSLTLHHAHHSALAPSSCTHLGMSVSSYTPLPSLPGPLPPARASLPLAPRWAPAARAVAPSMVAHHPLQLVVGLPDTSLHLGMGVSSYNPLPSLPSPLPPAHSPLPLVLRSALAAGAVASSMVAHHPHQLVVGSPSTSLPVGHCGSLGYYDSPLPLPLTLRVSPQRAMPGRCLMSIHGASAEAVASSMVAHHPHQLVIVSPGASPLVGHCGSLGCYDSPLSLPLTLRVSPQRAMPGRCSMLIHGTSLLVLCPATYPLVLCAVSCQHVVIVWVKRHSSVPPVTNPSIMGLAGGADPSTTCTTARSLATAAVGEPSHLPPQGQAGGLSLTLAPLPTTSPLTTSALAPIAPLEGPSHLPAQGQAGGLSFTLAPLTITSPHLELLTSHFRVGLIPLPSYYSVVSTTAMLGSIEADAEASLVVHTVGGGGSFGGMASALWAFEFGFEDELHFPSYSCDWLLCSYHGDWLEHLDYDLVMRRRPFGLVDTPASRRGLAMVLSLSVDLCHAGVKEAARALLYGAQAYAFTMSAWQDLSSATFYFSGGMAAAADFLLAWQLFGLDTLWFIASCFFSFIPSLAKNFGSCVTGSGFARTPVHFLFWVLLVSHFRLGSSVCLSCSGNDPNCKGDNTCALAKALIANVAVMAGTAGASKALSMGEDGKHILPLSWLQFLKPSVLQTLVRLAQRAPTGTPVDITSLSIKELSAHISSGTISVMDGRLDFLRRMSDDSVSDADLLKMKTICEVLPQKAEDSRFMSSLGKLSSSGALQFVFALATQIVHKLSNSSKVSVSVGESSSSSSSALVSIELKRPTSFESFSYALTVWQTLLCATGLANGVITGPFIAEVVHDVIPSRGWRVALEHFLLYIQKIDSGVGWQLASATSLGSHDTFLHNALRAAGELGKTQSGDQPHPNPSPLIKKGKDKIQGDEKPSWNGSWNKDPSARPCAAFNLGQEHKNLKPDGSCPFSHTCDQWVSDKGAGGQCKANHSRQSCTNAAKAAAKLN